MPLTIAFRERSEISIQRMILEPTRNGGRVGDDDGHPGLPQVLLQARPALAAQRVCETHHDDCSCSAPPCNLALHVVRERLVAILERVVIEPDLVTIEETADLHRT